MAEPIISFKDYGFQYMAQASPTLHHINLDIYPGEKVLIAGASGSGKSTIGSCINGLIPYAYPGESTGELLVGGKDPKKESIFALSQIVGTVLQDTDGQFIGLTVGEDIAFSLENDCVPQDEMKRIVDKTAKLVDIDHHLEYAPHELSGGQKQRVSLAGVMVENVKVLLFDEPLANLDPAAGRVTIELIDEVQKRTDAAVLIIEHRLEDVLWRHVDRIVLMDEGRIIADLPTKTFLSGELLIEHGIREPLYLTALRYAGIPITEALEPQHVDSLRLSEEQKEQVRAWYRDSETAAEQKTAAKELLRVENLSFGYTPEVQNLRDVSFFIREGEMVSIVGKNGAGKSTLAKLICGFEKPTAGRISLEGRDISGDTIKERAQRIGYVMQNPNQMISKPLIWDEVEMALLAGTMNEAERKERVEETLKICGLYPFRKWPVSALSYGQKKRVTIASVLVQRPQMIILDEPTAGQDYHHYTEIMEFLKELNAQGFTIVMITHDMHLMLEYTPRAIVFCEGELLADTTAAHVLNDPALVERANLKETSLYTLSIQCGIEDPRQFTERFVAYEEARREKSERQERR
ncbi:MAG: ABC transporter ATP-binding protein [Bacteroidales bacterium]|nr:ABC transporter ATP-binding protein [Bacteroidales bacterium]MCM1415222.1 ABC transporter ATP-binding protein [bacterium]MCM1423784.1 ABC transporter ATP-binding protein [bacterium]